MPMEPFTAAVALTIVVLTIKKVVDLLKLIDVKDWKGVRNQSVAWALGVAGAFLLAGAFGESVVQGVRLGSLNAAGLVIFGLGLGSGGSFVKDGLAAIDNKDTAAIG